MKDKEKQIDKDSVVLSREEYVDTLRESKKQAYEFGCKETAEKIFNQIVWYAVKRIGKTTSDSYYQISFERLQELAKQFGVETKEQV